MRVGVYNPPAHTRGWAGVGGCTTRAVRVPGGHRRWLGGAGVLLTLFILASVSPAQAAPAPLNVTLLTTDGVGRITTPGRSCDEGGDGAHWHYDYGSPLAPGLFSSLAGEVRAHVDLHSEDDATRIDPDPDPPFEGTGAGAFLQGEESHASLINQRGTVKLRLSSGSCKVPTLAFDGRSATGAGEWVVDRGVGAYRGATGSGDFSIEQAEVGPGADNALSMALTGAIDVLRPGLDVEVMDAYWGLLGADYLLRRVTVLFRITNPGPGDSFASKALSANSPTNGVGERGGYVPRYLGDLLEGESEIVKMKYELGLLQPCALVVLGCEFDVVVRVLTPDALDRPQTQSRTVHVRAPNFPPPL